MSDVDLRLLRETADRQQIMDVLSRYCRGIDRYDAEMVRSVYHDDAMDVHGPFVGLGIELTTFVFPTHQELWSAQQHTITGNVTIDLDGDTAHVESYSLFYGRRRTEDLVDMHGGRYVDRFERRNGEWRIAERAYIWEWGVVMTAAEMNFAPGSAPVGARDRTDLSYERPLNIAARQAAHT